MLYVVIGNDKSRPEIGNLLRSLSENPLMLNHGVVVNKQLVTDASGVPFATRETVEPNADVDFLIHAGNGGEVDVPFAILPYQQSPAGRFRPLCVTVPPGTQQVYPLSIRAPSQEGMYQMRLISASSPYDYLNMMDHPDSDDFPELQMGGPRSSFSTGQTLLSFKCRTDSRRFHVPN